MLQFQVNKVAYLWVIGPQGDISFMGDFWFNVSSYFLLPLIILLLFFFFFLPLSSSSLPCSFLIPGRKSLCSLTCETRWCPWLTRTTLHTVCVCYIILKSVYNTALSPSVMSLISSQIRQSTWGWSSLWDISVVCSNWITCSLKLMTFTPLMNAPEYSQQAVQYSWYMHACTHIHTHLASRADHSSTYPLL